MKRIIVFTLATVLFAVPALAIRAVDVQEGMTELKDVDQAISALGCMWNKGVPESSYMGSSIYVAIGSSSSDDCSCGVKCRAILSEIGFDKALKKLAERLQEKRNSIKIGE